MRLRIRFATNRDPLGLRGKREDQIARREHVASANAYRLREKS